MAGPTAGSDSPPAPVPSFCRLSLAGPGGRLGPHPLDLASGQGDADLANPFQLYAIDGFGIETRKVDRIGGLAAFDRLQVALAGLQPHHRLLAEEACKRVP